MVTLEESLALFPVGEGVWRAHGDPNFEAGTGMFGGWTAALLLKAVLSDERAQGEPATLNVNYVNRVDPLSPLMVQATPVGGSRSVSTWQVELRNESQDGAAAIATIVMAARRDGFAFTEFTPPALPDPADVPTFHPPSAFGQHVDMRPITRPLFNQTDSRTVHWTRDMTSDALDHVRLAYLADNYMPRVWLRAPRMLPSSTMTMSVYFYATAAELAAVGDGYVMGEAVGVRAQGSTCGSQLRLWSPSGALLATSEQMAWFKG